MRRARPTVARQGCTGSPNLASAATRRADVYRSLQHVRARIMTVDSGRVRRDKGEAAARDASFIMGGGETGALIRSLDWGRTLLGPAVEWPQSLRTAINICVSSRFPIAVYWGPQFVMLYN